MSTVSLKDEQVRRLSKDNVSKDEMIEVLLQVISNAVEDILAGKNKSAAMWLGSALASFGDPMDAAGRSRLVFGITRLQERKVRKALKALAQGALGL